ncbi:MAG TPA: hypothetical protein VD735_04865 [Candidatus Saccharimonadales bacterium]|nr:hypothetical protein [Candidatus Saccharimonadales bacterium]
MDREKLYKIGIVVGLAIIAISMLTTEERNVLNSGVFAGLGIALAMISLLITHRNKKQQ